MASKSQSRQYGNKYSTLGIDIQQADTRLGQDQPRALSPQGLALPIPVFVRYRVIFSLLDVVADSRPEQYDHGI